MRETLKHSRGESVYDDAKKQPSVHWRERLGVMLSRLSEGKASITTSEALSGGAGC